MKRKIITLITIIALIATMSVPAFAGTYDSETTTEVEYYPDGSYAIIETTVTQEPVTTFAAASTKTAGRTYTYYSSNNRKEWDFTLKGTFSYNGTSAKATKASTSYNIYITGWKCTDKAGTVSGATAKGSATFKFGTLIKNPSIGLKCSAKGEITKA